MARQASAEAGCQDITKLLLLFRAHVHTFGGDTTVLQAAAYSGHIEIVRALIQHGANINSVSGSSGS
jgi:ankyrin repeat protein